MVTYFLGDDEVSQYLKDFLQRLASADPFPTLWCPVTTSGKKLLKKLLPLVQEFHPEMVPKISVLPIIIDEKTKELKFEGDFSDDHIRDKVVLILDGAIHSGSTMARATLKVSESGASEICSYSLVIKCKSSFIPTIWGLMIKDQDRAFFLLDKIPNNRLHASAGKHVNIHIERLNEHHLKAKKVVSQLPSIDKVEWKDRYFDMLAGENGRCTYVMMMKSEIAGYLTIHHTRDCLVIDELALDCGFHGKKMGGILLRFAETLARHGGFRYMSLWAIGDKQDMYVRCGYQRTSEQSIRYDDKEEYFPMQREVLHGPAAISQSHNPL